MKIFSSWLRWFVFEFLSKVVMEFIWMIFSVSLGIFVITHATQMPQDQVDLIISGYGRWLVLILFNAAAVRVVLSLGLDRIDRQLDQVISSQQDQYDQMRTGMKLAIRMLLHRPIQSPDVKQDE